jgi:hypothetical protein
VFSFFIKQIAFYPVCRRKTRLISEPGPACGITGLNGAASRLRMEFIAVTKGHDKSFGRAVLAAAWISNWRRRSKKLKFWRAVVGSRDRPPQLVMMIAQEPEIDLAEFVDGLNPLVVVRHPDPATDRSIAIPSTDVRCVNGLTAYARSDEILYFLEKYFTPAISLKSASWVQRVAL